MSYDQMIRETLSGEMLQAYTTIKTEQQAEENMMGVVRAQSRNTVPSTGITLQLTSMDNRSTSPGHQTLSKE